MQATTKDPATVAVPSHPGPGVAQAPPATASTTKPASGSSGIR